jgi:transposase-like protein
MAVSKNALAWGKRFNRFARADVIVAQFCRQEGVSQAAFYQWRRKLHGQPAAAQ